MISGSRIWEYSSSTNTLFVRSSSIACPFVSWIKLLVTLAQQELRIVQSLVLALIAVRSSLDIVMLIVGPSGLIEVPAVMLI